MKTKKLNLTVLLSLCLLCFLMGFVLLGSNGVKAEVKAGEEKLIMDSRASLKMMNDETDSGIRFTISMDKALYDEMTSTEGTGFDAAYEVGSYIVPSDIITDGKSIYEYAAEENNLVKVTEIPREKWIAGEEGYMTSYVYLYDMPATAYNKDISAAAFVKNNGEIIYQTKEVKRSIASVAYIAKQDDSAEWTSEEMSILETYSAGYTENNINPEKEIITELYQGGEVDLQDYSIDVNKITAVYIDNVYNTDYTLTDTGIKFGANVETGEKTVSLITADSVYNIKITIATKVISTPEEMTKIFEYGNRGGEESGYSYDGYYILANDIDCTGYSINSIANFTGQYDKNGTHGFQGVFDGRGYTVKNLTVNKNNEYGTTAGIFGTVGTNGVIKNAAFENIIKNGPDHSGALALNLYGRLENVFISSGSNFYAPIAYIGPDAVIKNVVAYGTGWKLKAFAQMSNYDEGNNIQAENILAVGNKEAANPEHNQAVYQATSYFNVSTFLSDEEFLGRDNSAFDGNTWNVVKGALPTLKAGYVIPENKIYNVYRGIDYKTSIDAVNFIGVPEKVYVTTDKILVEKEYVGNTFTFTAVNNYGYNFEITVNVADAETVKTGVSVDYDKFDGGNLVIDLGDYIKNKTVINALIENQEVDILSSEGGVAVIAPDALNPEWEGEKSVYILCEDGLYETKVVFATKIIDTPEEMTKIFEYGNRGGEESGYSYDGYYILANDIDCTGYSINSIANFTGQYDKNGTHGFQGVFDGRGYTVKNLTVNENSEYGTTAGIFGTVGTNGVIKNAAFENIIKNGPDHSGALALNLYGRLENVFISSGSNFYAPIAYIGPDAVIKNVVAYGTGWKLKAFAQMSNYDEGNNIQAENILAIGNKDAVNPEHNQAIYNATKYFKNDNYKEDPVFTALNFEEMFDCTENGVWKISETLMIPVFKNMA